eukprot:TRINITY_DN38308_c0_g1_i1.p1 TRINITY_DN38308_c0_g1~~TRINITY_DN38308_c0_g1_i1.p1  ORF type:complete len:277 (+),score=69.22 TRINITY_DN38308_c0_g1_i1:43-873(+)
MGMQQSRHKRLAALTIGAGAVGAALLLRCLRQRRSLPLNELQTLSANGKSCTSKVEAEDDADRGRKERIERLRLEREIQQEKQRWSAAFVQAAGEGSLQEVRRLMKAPPDSAVFLEIVNSQAELPASGWTGITAVAAASLRGHLDVLQVLLEAKADPDLKCQHASCWDGALTITQRDTALCIAAKAGHLECAEALLSAGADVNVSCDSEFLEGAVEWGDEDDGTEMTHYSALDVADQSGQSEISDILRRRGAVKLAGPSTRPASRKMISSGSRMNA